MRKPSHVAALTEDNRTVWFRYGQQIEGYRFRAYRVITPPRSAADQRWLDTALRPRLMSHGGWAAWDWDPYAS